MPPFEVGLKGGIKSDGCWGNSSPTFCGENPIEEGPSRANDSRCKKEAPGEAGKITLCGGEAIKPFDKEGK